MRFYCEEAEAVLRDVDSTSEGLTSAEAEKRLAANGKNKLAEGKKDSLIKRFFMQMADPMILILLAAAAIAKSWVVLVYLPYLVLAGLITGTLTGLCAQLVVGRLSRN